MQFHEYRTIRNQLLASGKDHPKYEASLQGLKKISSAQYRDIWIENIKQGSIANHLDADTALAAVSEDIWVDNLRPYYNVWPIALELAKSVKLTLPFKAIGIPSDALLLRFARGHEPLGILTSLLGWPRDQPVIHIAAYVGPAWHRISLKYQYDPDEQVEEWLDKAKCDVAELGDSFLSDSSLAPDLLIRLCVFIALLANDRDVITPIILAKDQRKYESTDDPNIKQWLEDRAARRAGRGFDVGKRLQMEKEKSTHWRNPHLCLFWTGAGRTTPIIQFRSGAIVQSVSMARVPTGYLGPETTEELNYFEVTPREHISKSRRFAILKRDSYKCQLCGRSAAEGAMLHVDHRTPLARGGSNGDENLWTLCDQCNLGKSDSLL